MNVADPLLEQLGIGRRPVTYDQALPLFVSLVVRHLGETSLQTHAIVRDASGVLTLVLRRAIPDEVRRALVADLALLGRYVEPDGRSVGTPDDLFDPGLHDPAADRLERCPAGTTDYSVRLVERRIVGQDWLRGPQPELSGLPPIVAFVSNKGGVGRSTALAVTAADLAARNRWVLILDLDLEAPGLGNLLLAEEAWPRYGALDYYVESSLGPVDDPFLLDCLVASPLTGGQGQVDIVPATGQSSRRAPQNVLGKLARAYLEAPGGPAPASFLDRTRALIARLCARQRYDAVLVDVRAGLNETTAAAVLGLGAEVLLFGIDTPQTFEGYHYLLAHLARYVPARATEDDWRSRLRMVQAKASLDPLAGQQFRDRAYDLFAAHLYEELDPDDLDGFGFDLDDPNAPHHAWPIYADSNYAQFDPLGHPAHLAEAMYARTFEAFLAPLRERLGIGSKP